MPPTISSSYNTTELERILATLKENKLTLSAKLNLLRPAAASSPTYLSRFNTLEDHLIDLGQFIWDLEVKVDGFKEKTHLLEQEGYEDETRKALKRALQLGSLLDIFGETVMRLKISLEESPQSGRVDNGVPSAATDKGRGAADGSHINPNPVPAVLVPGSTAMSSTPPQAPLRTALILVNGGSASYLAEQNPAPSLPGNDSPATSDADVGGPVAKKQKLNPATEASVAFKPSAIKKEEGVAKPGKVKTWAPEGYYFVKAHFRRLPKRKTKQAEDEGQNKNDELPASAELVDLDGV